MIIPINSKIRTVPKAIKTLCGTCRYFAYDCKRITKTTIIRKGYLIVIECEGYKEEETTTHPMNWKV